MGAWTSLKRVFGGGKTGDIDPAHVRRLCWTQPGILQAMLQAETPGGVVDKEGSFQPTKEEIRRAIEAQALETRGNACMDAGRFSEAIGHYQEAARINVADGLLYQNVAVAHHRMGQTEKAQEAIRIALTREPTNPRILENARALGVR
jgi:tetratricopeptide (TPR) repeat protein